MLHRRRCPVVCIQLLQLLSGVFPGALNVFLGSLSRGQLQPPDLLQELVILLLLVCEDHSAGTTNKVEAHLRIERFRRRLQDRCDCGFCVGIGTGRSWREFRLT